ncbi:MAG: DUF4097 family beta strand repeat-containing protein [Acidobacteriota bacterium]
MSYLRQIRRMCSVTFVAVAAASLAACDVVINSMDGEFGGGRAKAEQNYAKTFTLTGPDAAFDLVNTSGSITVEAVDGTTVEVKAVITARGATEEAANELLKQVVIKDEASPSKVKIQTTQTGKRRSIDVKYTIRVPRTVKINVQNVNGAIDVTGVAATVRVETTNGGVKARGLGSSIDASTTNGGIDIQMTGLGGEGVRLDTTNGGIDLRLPADAKATLSARCVNGGISVTDLPFEKDAESNRRKVDGKINGGGVAIKIETVNGGVRVRQAQTGAKENGKSTADLSGPTTGHALIVLKMLKGLHGHAG